MTPRILFSDKDLSRTGIDLLSLIISLTLNTSNKYLAEYINSEYKNNNKINKLKKERIISH